MSDKTLSWPAASIATPTNRTRRSTLVKRFDTECFKIGTLPAIFRTLAVSNTSVTAFLDPDRIIAEARRLSDVQSRKRLA